MRSFMFCASHQIFYQIKKTEMGGACSMYGGEEKCIKGFGGETGGKDITWKAQA
jgi:hypothetical protein